MKLENVLAFQLRQKKDYVFRTQDSHYLTRDFVSGVEGPISSGG